MLQSGDILQERYRIVRRLNQGGMATVYLAQDTRLGSRDVAVKEMDPQAIGGDTETWAREAFRQEATLLARLDHPGLANVTDFFEEERQLYLVMEYVSGETLAEQLARSGQIDEAQVVQWARELTSVLAYLHRQEPPIVFRDIKPDNIMVQPDGKLKLIDFGIARFYKPGQGSDTIRLGTVGYAAPEQYGRGQTDPRADVYSLAVVLYQLLTGYDPGRSPLQLPPLRQLAPHVSPRLAAALEQAMALDPAQRFKDAAVFAQSLRPTAPSPTPPGPGAGDPPARKLIAVALVALLLVALGAGYWLFQGAGQEAVEAPPVPPQQAGPSPTGQVPPALADSATPAPSATIAPTSSHTPAPPASATPVPPTVAATTTAVAETTALTATERDEALERAYLDRVPQVRPAQPVVFAYEVASTPQIDGDLREWQGASYAVAGLVYGHEAWTGAGDLSGELRAAWDAGRLYLALDITDDRFVQESVGRLLYQGDSAELWLDAELAGDFDDGGMSADDNHIGASPGRPGSLFTQSYRWAPGEGAINDELAAARTDRGYTLEWAVPWSELRATPGDGAAFGFTVCLSDNDLDGAQEQQSMVCLHGTRRHNDPPSWGTLILVAP